MPDTSATALARYQRALDVFERRGGTAGGARSISPWLSFEPALEAEYLEHRQSEALPLTRVALMVSVVLYIVYFGFDAMTLRAFQQPWAVIPVLVMAGGLNTVLFLGTFRSVWKPYLPGLYVFACLVHGFAFAFVGAYGLSRGEPFPAEPAILQLTYAVFLLSIPFRHSLPVVVLIVTVSIVAHTLVGLSGTPLMVHCMMMMAAGILGTLACLLNERVYRQSWLRSRLLQELSEHDSLTGLYNHRIFYQRADQLLRQSRRDKVGAAVLVCDVDHFKKFNDSHGHLAGDEALRHVAKVLALCARRPLDIAARLGGEEFGLVLYNVSEEAALIRAEEVRNVVRGLKLSEGRRVTISIGVAMSDPARVTSIEALVGAADSALYRAKDGGRDRVSL